MDLMLQEAIRLRKLGFAIHWLKPNSKAPVMAGWSQAEVMDEAELIRTYGRGNNLGFRPGRWSVVDGKEICVLDIDIRGGKDYAEEAYAAAQSLMGDLYLPSVISGSVIGRHQFLGFPIGGSPDKAATTLLESDIWVCDGQPCDRHQKAAKRAWQVELLATGKNVVLPPSIHPETGKPYVWAGDTFK
jgi:hypothetical protein